MIEQSSIDLQVAAIIDQRVEQILRRHPGMMDPDLKLVGLVREVYLTALNDSRMPFGDVVKGVWA
jgi:hypothetical protein